MRVESQPMITCTLYKRAYSFFFFSSIFKTESENEDNDDGWEIIIIIIIKNNKLKLQRRVKGPTAANK